MTMIQQNALTFGYSECLSKMCIHSYMQEYVVEDLHGSYTPPKLDPEHEERLKMLKLL